MRDEESGIQVANQKIPSVYETNLISSNNRLLLLLPESLTRACLLNRKKDTMEDSTKGLQLSTRAFRENGKVSCTRYTC